MGSIDCDFCYSCSHFGLGVFGGYVEGEGELELLYYLRFWVCSGRWMDCMIE